MIETNLPPIPDKILKRMPSEVQERALTLHRIANENWEQWLQRRFPNLLSSPFAPHHIEAWNWIDSLTPGTKPKPLVLCLARGGGKSTTIETGVARVGDKLSRRYCLYLCGTQDNADKHVRSISSLLETMGMQRSLNRYGHARGWRRQELRAANGFNVAGFGLDSAIRGIKIDDRRPDWIILDDIDELEDTLPTIEKKVREITRSILPSGSKDCAVSFVQNVIHRESVMAQMIDGRADFLLDREKVVPIPALYNMEVEEVKESNPKRYHIVQGVPSWEGQDKETCEAQLNEWGLMSFRTEAQHEVYTNVPNQRFNNELLTKRLEEIRSGMDAPLEEKEAKRLLTGYPELRELLSDKSLLLWEKPKEDGNYLFAIDMAGGLTQEGGNDYCVLQILDADSWSQAGRLRGNWEAFEMAQLVDALGNFYGGKENILIAVLRLYGQSLLSHLIHDHKWPKRRSREWGGLYYYESSEVLERQNRQSVGTIEPGYPENVATKPKMIAALADAIEEEALILRDETTLMELLTYVKLPGGKTGGMSGCHDDCVSSLAVGTLLLSIRYDRRLRDRKEREEEENSDVYGSKPAQSWEWQGRRS